MSKKKHHHVPAKAAEVEKIPDVVEATVEQKDPEPMSVTEKVVNEHQVSLHPDVPLPTSDIKTPDVEVVTENTDDKKELTKVMVPGGKQPIGLIDKEDVQRGIERQQAAGLPTCEKNFEDHLVKWSHYINRFKFYAFPFESFRDGKIAAEHKLFEFETREEATAFFFKFRENLRGYNILSGNDFARKWSTTIMRQRAIAE